MVLPCGGRSTAPADRTRTRPGHRSGDSRRDDAEAGLSGGLPRAQANPPVPTGDPADHQGRYLDARLSDGARRERVSRQTRQYRRFPDPGADPVSDCSMGQRDGRPDRFQGSIEFSPTAQIVFQRRANINLILRCSFSASSLQHAFSSFSNAPSALAESTSTSSCLSA